MTLPDRHLSRMIRPSTHIQRLNNGEGTVHGFKTSKVSTPDTRIPGVRGSGDDTASLADDAVFHISFDDAAFATIQDIDGDPKTLAEAQSRTDWPEWRKAIEIETKTLENAGTWHEVTRPQGKNVVDCKWVFKIKCKADGSIQKYKARLVACGFTQIQGVDYYETYSPMARLASFRAIIALAAQHGWDIDSFDFNSAYLNGELDEHEEIYMQFPPGYKPQGDNTILRLRKTIYGLKQAG